MALFAGAVAALPSILARAVQLCLCAYPSPAPVSTGDVLRATCRHPRVTRLSCRPRNHRVMSIQSDTQLSRCRHRLKGGRAIYDPRGRLGLRGHHRSYGGSPGPDRSGLLPETRNVGVERESGGGQRQDRSLAAVLRGWGKGGYTAGGVDGPGTCGI